MSRAWPIPALAMLLLALACGDDDASSPATEQAVSPAPTLAVTTAPTEPPSSPADAGTSLGNGEPVAFQTSDGLTIHGQLLSVPGPNQRLMVFTAPDVVQYKDLYTGLVDTGLAVLVFDLRGHGQSEGSQDDLAMSYEEIGTAVRLGSSRDYPLIYVAGEGIGGTAALRVAAEQELAGLVLIGAQQRIELGGGTLDVTEDLASVEEPKLFIDEQGSAALDFFLTNAPPPAESSTVTAPFTEATDELRQLILEFVTR